MFQLRQNKNINKVCGNNFIPKTKAKKIFWSCILQLTLKHSEAISEIIVGEVPETSDTKVTTTDEKIDPRKVKIALLLSLLGRELGERNTSPDCECTKQMQINNQEQMVSIESVSK